MMENNQRYWYLNDHLGTPQQLIDQSGAVVWSARYTAYGQAMVDPASTVENNLRFPGQYYDSETGLHYNWHRYYDPETGRYMTPDPIGLEGGINLYTYVGGDPVNWFDPEGLSPDDCDRKKCIRDCLQKNYGDLYGWASTLNPLSAVSLGNSLYSDYSAKKLKQSGLRNKHTNWKVGKRQMRTLGQFGKFNSAMAVVGAGAFGFQLGADIYCYLQCL
jgi:RHS repeat-associated protein